MADELSVRERVTSTTTTAEPTVLKERLAAVREALRDMEAEVRRDAESLERLRGMLDFSYVEEIQRVVHELELKVREVGEEAERAHSSAIEAREQLLEEQSRLEKLWDVYKTQERDLAETRERVAELEDDLRARDDRVSQMQARHEAAEAALVTVRTESDSLRREKTDLLARVEELAALEPSRELLHKVEGDLETERERLAKLYAAYEEAQAQRDAARAGLERWEAWFREHGGSLRAVCRASQSAPGT